MQDSYTTEELLHAGRAERPPPGEGGMDIKGILSHMPQGIPVALEVPMTAMSAGRCRGGCAPSASGGSAVAHALTSARHLQGCPELPQLVTHNLDVKAWLRPRPAGVGDKDRT